MESETQYIGNDNRAVAILRVSSHAQRDNTSGPTQEKEIREYCARVGLLLERVFTIVETARRSELRKQHNEACAWQRQKRIKHRIYYKKDREARNLTDTEKNENEVRTGELVLHYALDRMALHKSSPDADFLMRDYVAVQNKHYSRDLSTKVRAATKMKAEQGWYPGTHTPLGYVHQKHKDVHGREFRRGTTVVINPNAHVVQQVRREFELRASAPTPSLLEIRRRIIQEGLVSPEQAKHYHTGTIERRLKNPFYDGRFEWQGVEYRGKHERLVTPEIFWQVQETFGMRNPYRKKGAGVFGGGWLKCGHHECGCNVVYDPKKKVIKSTGEEKEFRYYHCTNGRRAHTTMKGMTIVEDEIWKQFEPAVNAISITEDFAKQLAEALNETQRKAHRAHELEAEEYEAALKGLEGREDRLYDDYVAGVVDQESYRRQIVKVRKDRAHFTGLLRRAQSAVTDVALETAKTILELATNAESLWKMRTPQERKSFLDDLLSNPVLDGTTVRYELRKPFVTLSEMKGDLNWRRGRDSNPRCPCEHTCVPGMRLQPLGHLSDLELD